jgi:hypothetical protein
MVECSQTVALRLGLEGHVMFIQTVKVFSNQQIREKEKENFGSFFGQRSAFGPQMHIQSSHALTQRGPLLTVIIS